MFEQVQELCRVFCSAEMSGPHLRELDSKTDTEPQGHWCTDSWANRALQKEHHTSNETHLSTISTCVSVYVLTVCVCGFTS